MRLITKINLALAGVVAVSAILNFAALRIAVLPSFSHLEEQAADENHSRVLEAIELQKEQLASSAGDYAIWDDTYDFVNGTRQDYEEKNVTAESLRTLGVNFLVVLDTRGRVVIDKGFDYRGENAKPLKLLQSSEVSSSSELVAKQDEVAVQSALMRTHQGLVVLGYAPILRSDRSGERAGTLILGRFLEAGTIRNATKVHFQLIEGPGGHEQEPDSGETSLRRTSSLLGLDAHPVATVVSHTSREITAVGERTILTTSLFLLCGAGSLLFALGHVLRRIAVRRIEKLRSHLNDVARTGHLIALPEDGKGDELSETIQSFNGMARQLADLREKLRRQDYEHGAADQAAGILHNVRNALSSASVLAWHLRRRGEGATFQQHLFEAVEQLKDPNVSHERAGKLLQYVAMSVARMNENDARWKEDLGSLAAVLRHVEDILKEADQPAQLERFKEVIDIKKCVQDAVKLVEFSKNVEIDLNALRSAPVKAHRVPLDQVITNILVNAIEAIESSARESGRITILSEENRPDHGEAQVMLRFMDDGVGISQENLERIFEKGFSTKPGGQRGLGLHWCANAINAMGGKILATSLGADGGTMVTIILPSQQASNEAA